MKKILFILGICATTALLVFACGEDIEDTDGGSSGSDSGSSALCPGGQGGDCGSVTEDGLCEGNYLVWCDNGVLQCDDCEQYHCAEWSSAYGVDCLSGDGQSCSDDFPTTPVPPGCDPNLGLTCTGGTCS